MQQIYKPSIRTTNGIKCQKCSWQGTGNDSIQEYLFLTDATELFCPKCDSYIGFINEEETLDEELNY